ncbi:MAG: hypothetical protein ACYTGB_09600 [Planctomycetota bacterium]|jgi:hypothetical protein
MLRKLALVGTCLLFPAAALAHLCNDVFAQAKDNLAVKVDVRDGQLRIGREGTFRVWLLNTMDRGIANIKLEVRTGGRFRAEVKPSPDWKSYPALGTVRGRRPAKKQYFQVTLKRMPGVPDGQYKIDLHLFNGRDKSMVYKTVDMGAAAGIIEVPKASGIKVDGNAGSTEWGRALPCTGFHEYKRTTMEFRGRRFNKWDGKVPASEQCRFRVAADAANVYFYALFQGGAGATGDSVTFYAAPGMDSTPVKITVDRMTGKVACEKGTTGVECKVAGNKSAVELKVPKSLLGLQGAKSFLGNVSRETARGGGKLVTYWRGTRHSVGDPVEYANFRFAE